MLARQAQRKNISKTRLSTENEASSGNNSGARRKTKASGTIVKSRYMQTETKAPAKSSVQQQSMLMPPRPSSPRVSNPRKPRESVPSRRTISSLTDNDSALVTSILESSNVGGNVFQSTVLDGHCIRPDFDVSVIKDKVVLLSTADPKDEERDMAMETFLLAFLTAKIEHNTRKMREEAERNILAVMEKEQQLSAQVNRKKRQYLLLEKQKQLNSLLDLQIEALGPVAAAANTFAEEYKSFATAIDATRHKLPVKNVDIGEDAGQFLDKAVECLNQSAQVLQHYTKDMPTDCEASTECLREMNNTANEISQQLTRTFSDLLEVSSLESRETVLIQQSLEEDRIGQSTAQTLFCPSTS
ncbi:HAUS augmin-like complex subunit 8 isoform X2 [Sinocyclocheilus anshuiensis]|uniref:HAUS augmin-like complex subunit 8 isoform X2 n=1 Tax=Sinocyclocheilus anshuiensis TaxID=1608454 RepID=UPI0007BA3069|nr:PREDICTED: HAUS augmin-like complex subunit 8 isoform X2 [Sinocyclocheilus anshuiensis]